MDAFHTVVRPLITEKSTHQAQRQTEGRGGAYTFQVPLTANKAEIKDAIEKVYKVKVLHVRTAVREGKARRFRFRVSRTSATKKAVVVLDANSHINLF